MKYLIVVDMQNDFISMALGTKEAVAMIPAVISRVEEAKAAGYRIIVTMDTHHSDYLNTREGRFLPVEHCIKGTKGWKLDDKIKATVGNAVVFEKSTFGSENLAFALKEADKNEKIEEIELLGLCTDICVVSNALILKAAFPETEICVRESCCAGVTPESHKAALTTMKMCQIAIIE